MRTSAACRPNRFSPASSIASCRCASVVSRIGSTEWMRNGSMIVRNATAEVSSWGPRGGIRESADSVRGDAAPEPGHAAQRARRRSRARPRLREPRLPARRDRGDPPAVRRQALDRLPARVPRPVAPPAAAAGALHRAVLPRRGDRDGRRAPRLRGVPPRGLRPPRRDPGAGRSGRDRRAAARRAPRPRLARAAIPRRRRSTIFPTARSSCGTASRGSCSARSCCAGRPPATASASRGPCAQPRRRSRRRRSSPCSPPAGTRSSRCSIHRLRDGSIRRWRR